MFIDLKSEGKYKSNQCNNNIYRIYKAPFIHNTSAPILLEIIYNTKTTGWKND